MSNNPENGIVDGEDSSENMGLNYDDSNAPNDGGGDRITNGADLIYGNGGNDDIDGAGGNDTIFGDNPADVGATSREIFQWGLAPGFGNENTANDFTQDTGNVTIGFDVVSSSGNITNNYETTAQNTDNLDAAVAENQSFESVLRSPNASATYEWTASTPVENVEFRINDADGDAIVKIRAYDADNKPIEVIISNVGSGLTASNSDTVAGNDKIDSQDTNYTEDTAAEHSFLVTIPGPVTRWEIIHEQDGPNDTGINVTDMAFDAPIPPGEVGNDTIDGGAGDDLIDGGFGNDSIDGGADDDTIIASAGTDIVDGGTGRDTYDATADGAGTSYDGGTNGPGAPDVADPNAATHEVFTFNAVNSSNSDAVLDVSNFSASADGSGAQDFKITDGLRSFSHDDDDDDDGNIRLVITGNGGATGDGDNDIFRFDLTTYEEDFDVDIYNEDNADQLVFTGVTGRSDLPNGDVRLDYTGSDGRSYTVTVTPDNAQVLTNLDSEIGGPGSVTGGGSTLGDETIEVIVNDDGDGTVEKVADGTTDSVTSVENFVAGEASAEADKITLTDAVDAADIPTAITGLSDSAVGTFTPAGGGVPVAFGPGEAVQLSDILNGTSPQGSYSITDGDEDGQVGDISFENFETINFTVTGTLPDGVVDGENSGEVMNPLYDDANAPTDGGGDIIDGPDGLDDSIRGNGGNDTINAGLGNDTVDGGADNDSIEGGAGDDTLVGSSGHDTLVGGTGDDRMEGGSDEDKFVIDSDNFGNDVVIGGETFDANGDTLDATAVTTDMDVTFTGQEAGTLTAGANTVGFSEIERVQTGSGDDTVTGPGGTGQQHVETGAGDDSISGLGGGKDFVQMGTGDDTLSIDEGFGNATMNGGEGDEDNGGDLLDATNVTSDTTLDLNFPGNGTLSNGPSDLIFAQFEDIHLGSGDDIVNGSAGNDLVDGGAGNDKMIGGAGNDTFDGGAGNDTLEGGAGNDVLLASEGNDSFDGGADRDTLDVLNSDVSGSPINVSVDDDGNGSDTDGNVYTSIENFIAGEGPSADEITLTDSILEANVATDIQGLDDSSVGTFTTTGGDSIDFGGPGQPVLSDILNGTHVDPTLGNVGPAGSYTITDGDENGQIGNISFDNFETINFTVKPEADGVVDGENTGEDMAPGYDDSNTPTDGGGDVIDGSDGVSDSIRGNGGNDTIDAGLGNDTVDGGDDNDDIDGGEGNDDITGGSGNDTVDGGEGHDTLTGGDDNDTIIGGNGRDVVDDTDGNNVVDTSGDLGSALPDAGFPGYGPVPPVPADTAPDDDRDLVTTGDGDDTITTGDDADTINAGGGKDVIDSGIDDDIVNAGGGNDIITSGEGSDTVDGGEGNDTIYGGLGPSVPDSANIKDDADTFGPDPDPDNGRDSLLGGEGNDVIFGEDDADTLRGGTGNDTLDGGIDDDELYGDAGADDLTGGHGDDTLDGGADDDVMEGGDGNDTFVETAGDGADTIEDFGVGNTGPITDGDQTNNDFVDLSAFYNDATRNAVNNADADPTNDFADELSMLRADAADGRIDGVIDGVDYSAQIGDVDLTLEDGSGNAVTGNDLTYDNTNVACFARGTQIATRRGTVAIEELRAGDEVVTMDHGFQTIRWIGCTTVAADGKFAPVVIRRGAMGNERDLRVSPQHRMLVRGWHVELMFGQKEALVPAKALINDETVFQLEGGTVDYFHMMFDRHELIYAEGIPSESFHPGHVGLGSFAEDTREEILTLFPALRDHAGNYSEHARPSLKVREAKVLAENPELMKE